MQSSLWRAGLSLGVVCSGLRNSSERMQEEATPQESPGRRSRRGHLSYPILVQFSCSVMSHSLWPHGPQHARPPCPSPVPGVYPNSCPSSQWCRPTISSSVVLFSSYPILGSINLLDRLTELRETFHLPGCLFIIKRCNSGLAEWKRWDKVGERGWSFHTLCQHAPLLKFPCVHQPGCSLNPIFWGFYGDLITRA